MDQDGDFSRKEFIETCNAALANGIGNLLSRTLKLIDNNCDSLLPDARPENSLRESANELHVAIEDHMAKLEYNKAISCILALSDLANKYFNDEKPWTLFKEGKKKEGEEVLYSSVELLRRIAFQIYPFAPKLASDIWWQLGHDDELEIIGDGQADGFWDMIPAGQKVRNAGPIFKRLEEVKV
jgi:methionyl-tRNA synthetase